MTQSTPNRSQRTKPVIGLLGGPGSGKSAVARLFGELNCGVVDADALAHDAIQSDSARQQLRSWWGDRVFDTAGRVDRAQVAQIVFNDPAELERLENLIHPIVHQGRSDAREHFEQDPATVAIVEDCPLLIESGLDTSCDALVFVDCPKPLRLQRLKTTRGWSEEDLQKREEHQIPLDTKRERADDVIDNDVPLDDLREQVRAVLRQIVAR